VEENKFESWAIVELFGHQQIAGLVTEQQVGGQSFVRVDVPEVDGEPVFTKLYGSGAIYAITPCSEEVARLAVERLAVRPIKIWMPEVHRKLPPLTIDRDEIYSLDEEMRR